MLFLGAGAYGVTLFAEHVSPNPFLSVLFAIAAAAAVGRCWTRRRPDDGGGIRPHQPGVQPGRAFSRADRLCPVHRGEDGMSAVFSKTGFLDFQDKRVLFGFCLACLLLTCWG